MSLDSVLESENGWFLHRVTALANFDPVRLETDEKIVSDLRSHLGATFPSSVERSARFAVVESSISIEDAPTFVTIHVSVTPTNRDLRIQTVIALCWGRPVENGKFGFAYLLVQGDAQLCLTSVGWLERAFKCFVDRASLKIAPRNMPRVGVEWEMRCISQGYRVARRGRSFELVYALPSIRETDGVSTMTLRVSNEKTLELCRPLLEQERALTPSKLVAAIERFFRDEFNIDLEKVSVLQVSTQLVSLSASGKIVFKTGGSGLLSVLGDLNTMCLAFAASQIVPAPAET